MRCNRDAVRRGRRAVAGREGEIWSIRGRDCSGESGVSLSKSKAVCRRRLRCLRVGSNSWIAVNIVHDIAILNGRRRKWPTGLRIAIHAILWRSRRCATGRYSRVRLERCYRRRGYVNPFLDVTVLGLKCWVRSRRVEAICSNKSRVSHDRRP